MKFRPAPGRAVFLRDGLTEKVTGAGIIITAEAQDAPVTGVILAVGPMPSTIEESKDYRKVITTDQFVNVGDRVHIGKYAGVPLKIEGQSIEIITITDILGVEGTE